MSFCGVLEFFKPLRSRNSSGTCIHMYVYIYIFEIVYPLSRINIEVEYVVLCYLIAHSCRVY